MKICFFDDEPEIYPLQYGGKARTITNLAFEFANRKDVENVTILSRSIHTKEKKFKIKNVEFISLNDDNTILYIKKYMDQYDIFNIHCCSFTFPNVTSKAKKFYFLHDVLIATADKGSHLDKSLGGNFDAIIAPSNFAKSIFDKNAKILGNKRKCYVIPRNINEEMLNINQNEYNKEIEEKIKNLRKIYKYIIFFPNRSIPEKGQKYLLELSKLSNKNEFCYIGPFGNEAILPENFIDTRWIKSKDMKYYYSLCDVTLNLSLLPESFSQVCIESVYCETPIVTFASGNIPNLSNITDGIIIVEKNKNKIYDGVYTAIKMKKSGQMKKEKVKIMQEFNTKKIIDEYIDLYNSYL